MAKRPPERLPLRLNASQRKSQRAYSAKRRRVTNKTPAFGILPACPADRCRGGKVWAKVVPDVKAKTLPLLIRQGFKRSSVVCSDIWERYTGIAAKGGIRKGQHPLYLAEYMAI